MGKTTFDEIIEVVLSHEGGYVDDPDDRGGATNFGVTQASFSQYLGKKVSKDDVKNMTVEDAKGCYKQDFWDPSRAEQLDEDLRAVYFDMVVNHGQRNAVKILQQAANNRNPGGIDVDGLIGPNTIRATTNISKEDVLLERSMFYANLCFNGSKYADRTSQNKFLRGWVLNRVFYFVKTDLQDEVSRLKNIIKEMKEL
jgi:lysozyme family protein